MEWGAPGYDPGKLRSYHTAVLISENYCAASVLDLNSGKPLALVSVESVSDVKRAINELSASTKLPMKPALVTVVCVPDQSAMVPELLASDNEGQSHLSLLHGESFSGSLRNRIIEECAARFYFRHDAEVEKLVLGAWPSAMLYPMQMAVTRSALSRARANRETMLIHLIGKRLDLALINEQGPVLSNSFYAQTAEDVLYYVLFALEQTHTDKANVEVHYAGPGIRSKDISLLNEFLPSVKEASSTKDIPGIAPFRIINLTERDICVS